MISPFNIDNIPRIRFAAGSLQQLPELILEHGRRVLLITGAHSFVESEYYRALIDALRELDIESHHCRIVTEPAPHQIDEIVTQFHSRQIDCVVGIGGGSALDAAKAVAGLLPQGNPVMDYLEGVGRGRPYTGPSLPFIAVPTTAGTGSETTHNAVLGLPGPDGFRKSFRDRRLTATVALIDPLLHLGCPPQVTAACGMDALTQLIESYTSTHANPFCDDLALGAIRAIRDGLFPALEDELEGRTAMAYGAMISGICLAHAGLGIVHSLAPLLGSEFGIPHGVACGTLLAASARTNLQALRRREPDNPALAKFAILGRLLGEQPTLDATAACDRYVQILQDWTDRLPLPPLSHYGVTAADTIRLAARCTMRNNPIELTTTEVTACLDSRR